MIIPKQIVTVTNKNNLLMNIVNIILTILILIKKINAGNYKIFLINKYVNCKLLNPIES